MPGRVVRAADVAHLAGADEIVERAQRLLQIRQRVEPVHLVEVDRVGAEPAEARLAGTHDVVSRLPDVVRARRPCEVQLRRQDHLVAPGAERLAEDLLGHADRVDVRGVDQVDPRVEAHREQLTGLGDLRRAHGLEPALAAEGHRPERQRRDPEARPAEKA